ncbi:MAG: HlyC/CorC family transporter [Deltaproteobacteria bacterium]|nr:HlyC/CorC family transporter [Deltaproteobacteria bacterium]
MSFSIVFICILLSAVLSAAEIAFVTSRRSQIRSLAKSGHKQAQILRHLRENPERTLSVIQLGESFVNTLATTVGFIGTAKYLSPWLVENIGLSFVVAQLCSIAVVVTGYTYLDVVFGELVPKVLALRHPLWVATATSRFLWTLECTMKPLVSFLEWSTRSFVQIFFRVKAWSFTHENEAEFDLDSLPDPHRHLVLNAVALERRRVQEIYLPWENVLSLDWTQSFDEVAVIIASTKHTRLPVLKDGKLEGILNSRDFMAALIAGKKEWHPLLRKATRMQENVSLLHALKILRGRRNQLAVVYSGPNILGILTMRDIFDQIVGDIYDENDANSLRHILAGNDAFKSNNKSMQMRL